MTRPRSPSAPQVTPVHLVAAVRARLAAAADPAAAGPMQRYMKSALPFHGLKTPDLRRIVRACVAQYPVADRVAWEQAVRTLYDEATHREERYAALAIAGAPRYRAHRDAAMLPLWRHLITNGGWWDLVDTTAGLVDDALRADPAAVRAVVWAWATDDDLWLRRAAIISQLRAKGATDLALLTHAIDANLADSRYGSEFFIRKAIGWALRQYARVDPTWVLTFVAEREDKLSGLSRREALKRLERR